jgi:AI-2 transport protein TqsA
MNGSRARALLIIASIIVILAGVRATSALLIPFVLALFLTLISFPLVRVLQSRGVPRPLAVVATILAILAMLVGPSMLVVTAVRQFVSAVPGYEDQLRRLVANTFEWLRRHDVDTASVTGMLDPGQVLNVVVGLLSGVATMISIGFLVVLISAFMLFEAADILDRRQTVLPTKLRDHLARVGREMQIWLWVKTVISLGTGLAAGLWVALLGVEFALLWGLTAFALNYIPTIGSIVAAVPPAVIALILFGPLQAGLVVLGFVAINIAFGNFMEPLLMGRRIGLSPLVVVLSVFFWGWMWGPVGMLLSVPITMTIKIALENSSEDLRWVAQMIGGGQRELPLPAETAVAAQSPADRLRQGAGGPS